MSSKKLMGLDDMYRKEDSLKTGIIEIEVEKLVPFRHHPFKEYQGERLNDMIKSIQDLGILTPIIVRPQSNGKYEILSGHNRKNAAVEAGLTKVSAIIKEGLTETEAILIVTESNTMQRSFSDLSHSECAAVISTRHKAMTSQGIRSDLINEIERLSNLSKIKDDSTFSPLGKKCHTHEIIGETYNLSKNSIARYLRISKLNETLQSFIDSNKLSIRAAVDLSYLSVEEQRIVCEIVIENELTITMKIAKELRRQSVLETLDDKKVMEIVIGKKHAVISRNFKLKDKLIKKYFSSEFDNLKIEEIIDSALREYFSKQNSV